MNKELRTGDRAPDFTMPCAKCGRFTLSEKAKGSPVLLYFYPVNYGQTCTRYIAEMNEFYDEFEKIGVKLFHVNPGTVEDHSKWMERTESKYDHISDTGQAVSKRYGMIMVHPEYPNILGFTNRGFVLIDENLIIRYIWRAERPIHTVDMKMLVDEIVDALR